MQNSIIVLALMFWMHFVDDYFLQNVMATMKQKSWWEKNSPDPLYKKDYIMALICHALMWSISIMIPLIIFGHFIWWLIPINFVIHSIIDDLKANRHKINLIVDQSVHFTQIIVTWAICMFVL